MRKIIRVSVPEFRKLHVLFDDGTDGTIKIEDSFSGVAQPLNEPQLFASAKVIDEGYAVGFDNCEYDICSNWIYEQLADLHSLIEDGLSGTKHAHGRGNLRCAEDRDTYQTEE